MSDPQSPDLKALDAAIQSAVDALVSDLVKSAGPAALQQLALSGLADGFAIKWQDVPSYRNLAMLLTHDSRIRPLVKPSNADAPVLYSYMIGTPMWVMKAPAGLLAASCFDLLAELREARDFARSIRAMASRIDDHCLATFARQDWNRRRYRASRWGSDRPGNTCRKHPHFRG